MLNIHIHSRVSRLIAGIQAGGFTQKPGNLFADDSRLRQILYQTHPIINDLLPDDFYCECAIYCT